MLSSHENHMLAVRSRPSERSLSMLLAVLAVKACGIIFLTTFCTVTRLFSATDTPFEEKTEY